MNETQIPCAECGETITIITEHLPDHTIITPRTMQHQCATNHDRRTR